MKNYLRFVMLGVLLAPLAYAQTPNEPETTILSDSLSYDDTTKSSVFKGNVILTRGLMRLTADEMQTQQDAQGTQHGKALSLPNKKVVVYQERPETYETFYAEGKTATYNGATEVVNLTGSAVVIRSVCGQAVDTIRGETIIYNSKQGTYQALGGGQDGRIRSVASARNKVNEATKSCQEKYRGKPMPSSIQEN